MASGAGWRACRRAGGVAVGVLPLAVAVWGGVLVITVPVN